MVDYQTSHFLTGFIGEPTGQLKSLANSCLLLSGPSTRNWAGECSSVIICIFNSSKRRGGNIIRSCMFMEKSIQNTLYLYDRPSTNFVRPRSRTTAAEYILSRVVLVQGHFVLPTSDKRDMIPWCLRCQLYSLLVCWYRSANAANRNVSFEWKKKCNS